MRNETEGALSVCRYLSCRTFPSFTLHLQATGYVYTTSKLDITRGPGCQMRGGSRADLSRIQYQNIDGLVDGPFGYDVLDPRLIHIHGPPVLEDGTRRMEVLGAVHLVVSIEKEVPRLISHSCVGDRIEHGLMEGMEDHWRRTGWLTLWKGHIFDVHCKLEFLLPIHDHK